MEHSFDVATAQKYGIHQAIFIRHMQWWCIKNRANNKHFRPVLIDGSKQYRTFTYNTAEALAKMFPYFSVSQIYRIVTDLREKKVIAVVKYADNPYDKTNWYCFIDEDEFGINNIKQDVREDEETEEVVEEEKLHIKRNEYTSGFEDQWKRYSKGSKLMAFREWTNLPNPDKIQAAIGIDKFIRVHEEYKFRPDFCRYLKNRRWEDEDAEGHAQTDKGFRDYKSIKTGYDQS